MNDELLKRAVVALREQYRGESRAAFRTEANVVAQIEQGERRVRRWRWVLPLVAACTVSTAWAAGQVNVFAVVRSWLIPAFRPGVTAERARKAQTPKAVVSVAVSSEVFAPGLQSSTLEAIETTDANSRATVRRTVTLPVVAEPIASTPDGVLPASTPLALYREAQRRQSGDRDFQGALIAWERYLQSDPHGPLVLEARYHRAVCLAQLGRVAEARAALLPFAAGDYGSYRRESARKLLTTLPPP